MSAIFQKLSRFAPFSPPPTPRTRIDSWRALVTGANIGPGFEAAKYFARQGASMILACRSRDEAPNAKAQIDALLGLAPGIIQVLIVDMESFDSIRDFASSVGPVDGIILNESVVGEGVWNVTGDGWERMLLLSRALERRKEVAGCGTIPTITIATSHMYRSAEFKGYMKIEGNIIEALNDESKESDPTTFRRYPITKLLGIYIAHELAAIVPKAIDGNPLVIVNYATPGFCYSELLREYKFPLLGLFKTLFARITEMGARTYFHSIVDAGPDSHSKFIDNSEIESLPKKMFGTKETKELQRKVWDDLMEIVEEVAPELKKENVDIGDTKV
ncbi:hypothetical protein C7212DRAFT_359961 [Tuber magnatum]|uniref:NAD(P)-binding protein n=1 Tax=Tuber magnatum TaxID=42249 RepID=A0A317SH81_9PEZI|nr:hypothetical protein C7212DRAFT_359961 [Tuber magnatum]